jgi:NAD(P)-dependent dehydrogenase (short-subunit alcohol dehydrogenase family)
MTKTAVVTGAASGLGQAIALGLARAGHAVVLVVRSPERGDEATRAILAQVPDARLEPLPCDLSSQASIREAAAEFLARHETLDVLVNAAGVFRKTRNVTADGLEETFATNYLAYFHLTNLLLPALRRAEAARVVNITSKYSNGPWSTKVDFDDLQTASGTYSYLRATPKTMVARVLFTQELAERLRPDGITVNAVHPGLVKGTRLLLDTGGPFRVMTNLVGKTPDQAADTALWLATSPEAAHETGKLWAKRKPLKTPGQGRDPAARQRLWAESEKLVGLG